MPAKGVKKPKASDRLRLVAAPFTEGYSLHRVQRFDATHCTVSDIDGESAEKKLSWRDIMLLVPVTASKMKAGASVYALSMEQNPLTQLLTPTTVYYLAKYARHTGTGADASYTIRYVTSDGNETAGMIPNAVNFPEYQEMGVPGVITVCTYRARR